MMLPTKERIGTGILLVVLAVASALWTDRGRGGRLAP